MSISERSVLLHCEYFEDEGGGVFLFLDGGHRFPSGVVQVVRRGDGKAALSQDPLCLVHVGA